jgi:hypothetical protein
MAPNGKKTAMQPRPPLLVGLEVGERVALVLTLACFAVAVLPPAALVALEDGLGLGDALVATGVVTAGCAAVVTGA